MPSIKLIGLKISSDGGPMPVTQADLDPQRCDCNEPNCDGGRFSFVPACHPTSGVVAGYLIQMGVVELSCRECGAGMIRIMVASPAGGVH